MANVKNFGLKGVAADVQFGKNGGRFVWDSGTGTFSVNDSLGAKVKLKGLSATESDDFATLADLQNIASGINVKSAAVVATITDLVADEAAEWTTTAGGTFTGVPAVIDGYTLINGDRVLVRLEGATYNANGQISAAVEADAVRNGIYVSDGAGGLTRALDYDTNAEITFGDYVFVTSGSTTGGVAYMLSNYFGIDTAPGTPPVMNTDGIIFIIFSIGRTYDFGAGLEVTNVDDVKLALHTLQGLTPGTSSLTGSYLALSNNTSGSDSKTTLGDVFDTHNVVYGLQDFATSGAGYVGRVGEDQYRVIDFLADTTAGQEGLKFTQDFTTNYNAVWGLDITGLSASALDDTAFIVAFDGVNNVKRSLADFVTDLNLADLTGLAAGLVTTDGAGAASSVVIAVNSGAQAGLSITNADGVAGNPTLGLNINGLTAATAVATDSFVFYDGTDSSNKKTTIQDILDLAAAAVNPTQIAQGDSSVVVADAGTGTITMTVDATEIVTVSAAAGLTATSLTGSDLVAGKVLFAGTAGKIETDSEFSYDSTTNALTVAGAGSFNALTTTVGGVTAQTTVSAGGNITSTGGNITASSGIVTGNTVVGTNGVSGSTFTAGAGGITDTSLVITGGLVFTDGTNRLVQDTGFTYDSTTNTLSVDNIAVSATGAGYMDVAENEIAFGNATGGITGSSAFTVNSTTSTVAIGTLSITGGASQTITGTAVDANISIVPNGTGEVIIGSTGAGVISSDTSQSMTISGDTDLFLESGTGSVFIVDNGLDVAKFESLAGADASLVFQSDTTANGVKIGTSADADIKFVLGSGKLVKVSDGTAYDAALASDGGTALVTKSYVDAAISSGAAQGAMKSLLVTVPLDANATVSLGSVPAGSVVTKVSVKVVTPDTTATLDIGDVTVDRLMTDAENDPQAVGIYVVDTFDLFASSTGLNATVAGSAASSGASAEVMIEYRVASA